MKKIGIGVGGRFHSDFMYQSFIKLGHLSQIFTSLPKSRFSVPNENVLSYVWPELVFRATRNIGFESSGDAFKMRAFGKFLARSLALYRPDLFVGWSSFSLEALQSKPASCHVLMRDSTHIKFQYELLREEYEKFGHSFPKRAFCLERELEEYQLADRIWVLSEFAKKTFVDQGISSEKLDVLPLGVDLERFKPLEVRFESTPLRVIYFGILSFRKGVQYLLEATKDFSPRQLELNLIGAIEPEFKSTLSRYAHFNYHKPMTQVELAKEIRKHHVYVFPTIEDGFGQTLIQAMASGLVPITTTNCGAADFTSLDKLGLRIATKSHQQIKEKLEAFIESPDLLNTSRVKLLKEAQKVSWESYQSRLSELVS